MKETGRKFYAGKLSKPIKPRERRVQALLEDS